MSNILVVDDEVGIRELLSEILADEGYRIRVAASAEAAREARRQERPDLVLLDVWMPDTDGISLLKEWSASGQLTMPVVIMSGHGSIDSAVEAMRIGALDYLEKPIALQKLLATVKRALAGGETVGTQPLTISGLGRSTVMADLRRRLQNVSANQGSVLMRGEPGIFAEMLARALHTPGTPFVAAAPTLGDAPFDALGRAAGGILYLDDLMSLSRAQCRGLGMLALKADRQTVRLVSYASADPVTLVSDGTLPREALARLSAVIVPIPPLRDHLEDVPDIASRMLALFVERRETPARRFTTAALNHLRNYHWPRNMEQLQQVVRSAALLSLDEEIAGDCVESIVRQFAPAVPSGGTQQIDTRQPLREARDAFERAYFERMLAEENGSITRVSDRSGMERTHLYRKLRQLGVATGRRED